MNDISNYIPSATGNWLGDIGMTKQIENIEFSMDSVQPAPEGVCVDRFPFNALRFSGFVNVSEDELTDYYVVLSSESRQYVFDLGYTKQNTADGIKITLSRWISLNGLDSGAYSVDIVMNDVVYETGKNVRIENK